MKPTFKESYNKIIDAYFRDEIKPLKPQFCFCGTICDNTTKWFGHARALHFDSHGYKGVDFLRMETALLDRLDDSYGRPSYEDDLFAGMCAALEVLKQIHIERGDSTVNEVFPEFTKRELSKI